MPRVQLSGPPGAPGGIRTPDPRFRRPMLFPLSYRRKWPPSLLTAPVYHTKHSPTTRHAHATTTQRLTAPNYGVGVPEGCVAALLLIDNWIVRLGVGGIVGERLSANGAIPCLGGKLVLERKHRRPILRGLIRHDKGRIRQFRPVEIDDICRRRLRQEGDLPLARAGGSTPRRARNRRIGIDRHLGRPVAWQWLAGLQLEGLARGCRGCRLDGKED